MPGSLLPPGADQDMIDLKRRVGILERKLTQVIESRIMPTPLSFSGPVPENVESPAWRPVHPVSINLLVADVLVAPSGGDMTIDFTLYGPSTGVVRTVTVLDGTFYTEDATPFVIPQGGRLTATVTAAFGAADLAIAAVPELL